MTEMLAPARAPRSQEQRSWVMALYVGILLLVGFAVDVRTGLWDVFHAAYFEHSAEAAREASLNVDTTAMLAAAVLHLTVFGLLAGPAGYGGARFLQMFVPAWNVVVVYRILWRWTDIQNWNRAAAAQIVPAPSAWTPTAPAAVVVDVTPAEKFSLYR